MMQLSWKWLAKWSQENKKAIWEIHPIGHRVSQPLMRKRCGSLVRWLTAIQRRWYKQCGPCWLNALDSEVATNLDLNGQQFFSCTITPTTHIRNGMGSIDFGKCRVPQPSGLSNEHFVTRDCKSDHSGPSNLSLMHLCRFSSTTIAHNPKINHNVSVLVALQLTNSQVCLQNFKISESLRDKI